MAKNPFPNAANLYIKKCKWFLRHSVCKKKITQFIFICCVHCLIFGIIIFLLRSSFLNAPKTTCRRSLNSHKSTQHPVLSRYTIVKWNTGYWEPSCDDLLTVPVLRLQICFCLYKLLLLFPGILLMCFIKSNYAIINYCRHFFMSLFASNRVL